MNSFHLLMEVTEITVNRKGQISTEKVSKNLFVANRSPTLAIHQCLTLKHSFL